MMVEMGICVTVWRLYFGCKRGQNFLFYDQGGSPLMTAFFGRGLRDSIPTQHHHTHRHRPSFDQTVRRHHFPVGALCVLLPHAGLACLNSTQERPKARQATNTPTNHTAPQQAMDFDRSVSKLKKEQEKRRAEALRKAERYVACVLCLWVAAWVPSLSLLKSPPSLCPTPYEASPSACIHQCVRACA